jgi:hypothetical protein
MSQPAAPLAAAALPLVAGLVRGGAALATMTRIESKES